MLPIGSLALLSWSFILYLFLAALGLHCSSRVFSSCGKRRVLSSCSARASHCSDFSCGVQGLERGLSSLCYTGFIALKHVGS